MAVFPVSIAQFVPLPLGLPVDPVQPADYTGLRNEILAIEEELGVNPAGEVPTVASRLGVQFSEAGGWRGFQFGVITNDFSTQQNLSFDGGRFTRAPQILAINATGFAASGEPAIFYSADETETTAVLFAYNRTGNFSSTSATVIWMAYSPAVDGNGDDEAEAGEGIPPAGVDPTSQVVDDRPYYFDPGRQRWLSYETWMIIWNINGNGIVASAYMNIGPMLSNWGRVPVLDDMVLIEMAARVGNGTSSSSSSIELWDSGSPISGASIALTTMGSVSSASYNVEIPAGTLLQAYLVRGGSDSIGVPLMWARLKYIR
jgi:hypothetical protein